MANCWIGIGANLGDARGAFDVAWDALGRANSIQRLVRSGLYRTRPVGAHAGGCFSNAVMGLSSTLPPLELLDLLLEIENELGRVRELRWGPRPLDLDLLYVDQELIQLPRLIVPHPAAWYRRFVLDPLVELAPQLRHPLLNQTMSELALLLNQRPLAIGCHPETWANLASGIHELTARFPEAHLVPTDSGESIPHVVVRLFPEEPSGPVWRGVPVAELTTNPGDPLQRLIDFLSSALDQPIRSEDW